MAGLAPSQPSAVLAIPVALVWTAAWSHSSSSTLIDPVSRVTSTPFYPVTAGRFSDSSPESFNEVRHQSTFFEDYEDFYSQSGREKVYHAEYLAEPDLSGNETCDFDPYADELPMEPESACGYDSNLGNGWEPEQTRGRQSYLGNSTSAFEEQFPELVNLDGSEPVDINDSSSFEVHNQLQSLDAKIGIVPQVNYD